jgi:hypothetical protein
MSDRVELIAVCPFCGDVDCEVAESAVPSAITGKQKHAVYCNACFCEGPTHDAEEGAIAAWNRRTTQEDASKVQEAQVPTDTRQLGNLSVNDLWDAIGVYCDTVIDYELGNCGIGERISYPTFIAAAKRLESKIGKRTDLDKITPTTRLYKHCAAAQSPSDVSHVLHVLRNPFGFSSDEVRSVRLKAAELIERYRDAYTNMREFAEANGLDTTARNQ